MLNPEDKFNYGRDTRGTKDKPYSSFSEAMSAGREGENVYIGDMLTKMAYAPDKDSSVSKVSDGIKDVSPPSFFEQVFGIGGGQNGESSFNMGSLAKTALTLANPALGIPMMLSSGIGSLFKDKDGDGSPYTSSSGVGDNRTTKNFLGQTLNMGDDRKIKGFFDSMDVDGDGSFLTSGGSFFTPQTDEQQQSYLDLARRTSDGGPSTSLNSFSDPNQESVLADGTPKCKFGFVYDATKNMCVEQSETTQTVPTATASLTPVTGNPFEYGMSGEQVLSSGITKAKNGMALPVPPTGIVQGRGGPKDDLVGPIALSAGEFISPVEQIQGFDPTGRGDYRRGIAALENHRRASLNKFG